jgi:hypothetical protein
MFTTFCPGCESSLNAPDTLKGKKVKCKKCGEPFVARPAVSVDDEDNEPTEEGPAIKRKKSARRPADEDTEIMEPQIVDDDEDEEPRPKLKKKKGKGKRRKEKAPPVMLFVLIGVGALLVLGGGGVGAYYAFFNEEKKADTQAKGAPNTGGAAAMNTDGWIEHNDAGGRFKVRFPKAPMSRVQSIPLPGGGAFEMKSFGAEVPPEVFIAGYYPLPADRGNVTDQQVLSRNIEIYLANMQSKGVVEKSRKDITYQGYAGADLQIQDPKLKNGGLIIRFVVASDRVILLIAGADNPPIDSSRFKAFFESLKIE